MMEEREAIYCMCIMEGIGAVGIRTLKEFCGSYDGIFHTSLEQLRKIRYQNGRKVVTDQIWNQIRIVQEDPESCLSKMRTDENRGIHFVAETEKDYPKRLLSLYDRPAGLFYRGNLPEQDRPSVAIIGARSCSEYGKQIAELFGKKLSEYGVSIISGLALGADCAAQQGAIEGNGLTYSVLGCGPDICYPRENYRLCRDVIRHGGILSEFPPGTPPAAPNFPMRNRIISGLADVVLVTEAKERSGSLITADLALDQGKEVFAVPGRITDRLSVGCNRLIRNGAGIALAPSDILGILGIDGSKTELWDTKREKSLAKNQKLLYSCLDLYPKHLEEIMSECHLPLSRCLEILTELEFSGLAVETGNQYYCRKL